MNKINSICVVAAVLLMCGGHVARAQEVAASASLKLPDTVRLVVSVDAHNILLVETESADDSAESVYSAIVVRHIYSGGLARILGGTVVPTEMMVSPVFNKGGFGARNPSGISAVNDFNGSGLGQILNGLDRAPQQVGIGR